ncbi:hypothetical protein [Wenzhouxiangella marina]|nr:hypothetical protein [Wenzhouxiangella marina]
MPTGGLFEPARQQILLTYESDFQPLVHLPPRDQRMVQLRSLLVHEQLAGTSTAATDIWIDPQGRAWLDPTEPTRTTARSLDNPDWASSPPLLAYTKALQNLNALVQFDDEADPLARLNSDEPLNFSQRALLALYDRAVGTQAGLKGFLDDPQAFLESYGGRCNFAGTGPASMITYDPSQSTPSEGDCDHEWFNGLFWEPCRVYRADAKDPKQEDFFLIETNFGLCFEGKWLKEDQLRARSVASAQADITAVSGSGESLEEGALFTLCSAPQILARVLEARCDGSVALEFKQARLSRTLVNRI